MIVLDTHIWIWWVDDNQRLTQKHREWIADTKILNYPNMQTLKKATAE